MEDEVSALAETLRKAAQKWASELVDKPPYWEALAEAAMPTLRAALAPPADVAGTVEAIRARHEYAEQKGGDLYTPEYCEWSFSQCHRDRATLLKEHDRQQYAIQIKNNQIEELEELLSEERARRVEWQPIETAPRDGQYILAIVGKNDSQHMAHLEGRVFAVRPEPFGTGWSVYPGYGGAPSEWFTCWKPLDLPATHKDTQDGAAAEYARALLETKP